MLSRYLTHQQGLLPLLLCLSSLMLDVSGMVGQSNASASKTQSPLLLLVDVYDTTFLVGSKDKCLPACTVPSDEGCKKDLGNDDVARFGLGQRRKFGVVRDNGCPFPHLSPAVQGSYAHTEISAVIHTDFTLQDDYDACSSAFLAESPFLARHEILNYSKTLQVAWLVEPRQLSYESYSFAAAARAKFDLIFTHMQEYVRTDSRKFRFCPFGTTYLRRGFHQMYNKTKMISIIASRKGFDKGGMQGHRLRHEVIRSFSSMIDGLFANGYERSESGWQDNKIAGLRDFRFSIVIENVKEDCWFTEKLIDCFLTGTIPIYWGCPTIHEHFDTRGMILFEDSSELAGILDGLSPQAYESMLPFARRNFETARQHYLDPLLWMWERGISPLLHDMEQDKYQPVSRACRVPHTSVAMKEDHLEDEGLKHPDIVLLLLVGEVKREFLLRSFESILGQSYKEWRCVVSVNNASLHQVREVMSELNVFAAERSKFTLQVAGQTDKEHYSPLYHILSSMDALQDSDVLLLLNAGDWLHGQHSLQEIVEAYGDGDVWLTYGRAIEYPAAKVHAHVRRMTEEEVRSNGARYWDFWTFGPPYSFKVGLVRGIHPQDLTSNHTEDFFLSSQFDRGKPEHVKLDENFRHVKVGPTPLRRFVDFFLPPPAWEPALILPLVEMAGRHARCLDRVVYVFNVLTRKELHRHSGISGHPAVKNVRYLPRYTPLVPPHPPPGKKVSSMLSSCCHQKYFQVKWLQPRDGQTFVVEEHCKDQDECHIVLELEAASVDVPWQGCLKGWLNLFPILKACSTYAILFVSFSYLPSGTYRLELEFVPDQTTELVQEDMEHVITFRIRRANEPVSVLEETPEVDLAPVVYTPEFRAPRIQWVQ